MNTPTPTPIDHEAEGCDLAAVARDACRQLVATALLLDSGGAWAVHAVNDIEAGGAEAELHTTFATGRALSAIHFTTGGKTACIAEFSDTDANPWAQTWTDAVWRLCVTAFKVDGGQHGSIALQDQLLDGRAAVTTRAKLTQGAFAMRADLRSHGAATVLFQIRQQPEPPLVVH